MFIKPLIIRNVIRSISIVLFVAAMTQVCFDTESAPGESGEGAALVISGFFGFFSSITGLTWLANPALWYSWVQITRKPNHSLLASMLATIISLSFLLCKDMIVNEGGTTSTITDVRIGYWLWLSSIGTMLIGNFIVKYLPPLPSITRSETTTSNMLT
jgi:hypothetical protein